MESLHGLEKFTDLDYRHLGPDQWQLTRTFMYFSHKAVIVVPFGFKTDLDSLPRIPMVYAWLKGRSVRAVVIHDYLYKTQQGKAHADITFLHAMKDEGLPKRHRVPIYLGVACCGWFAYRSHRKDKA